MKLTIISWILRLFAALILGQAMVFKLTGAEESVAMFTLLNAEPFGRIAAGVVELAAAILLLIPRTTAFGGVLGASTMLGALFSHATKLGFAGDMMSLGVMAVLVLFASLGTIYLHRGQIPPLAKILPPAKES